METKEVKQWLQRYFNGESTLDEERLLRSYFRSEKVADELKAYTPFFEGLDDLHDEEKDGAFEEGIMNYILEKESGDKTKYRGLWRTVTGIAASVILIIGGMLLYYQNQEQGFKDTFEDPQVAYAYAEHTLKYVSSKYNKGLEELAQFDKIQGATKPMQKGIKPLEPYFEMVENIGN